MKDPFLIIVEHGLCLGTLADFSLGLGRALEALGEEVVYFTPPAKDSDIILLDSLVGRRFSAVFGIHSVWFTFRLPNGAFFMDYVEGPKYQFMLDSPVGIPYFFTDVPRDFHVLTIDQNYKDLLDSFFPNVATSHVFYPGCSAAYSTPPDAKRDIPLLFFGNYTDYRPKLERLRSLEGPVRELAQRYLCRIDSFPEENALSALEYAMSFFGSDPDRAMFPHIMAELNDMDQLVFNRYRELTVRFILEAGVPLTVAGDSWKSSPFADHPLLTILPSSDHDKAMSLYQRSRLSLNIMTAHRDAVTERITESMICGAAVASSATTGLSAAFTDDDLLLFPLGKKDVLCENAQKIKDLLSDGKRLRRMAENGHKKALAAHTWDARAKQFLDILAQ